MPLFRSSPDQGFPSGSVRLVRNPATVPLMADGSLLRSGGETWEPVSPDNVHETGVWPWWTVWIPHHGRGGAAGRANSKKDLLNALIRVSVPFRFSSSLAPSRHEERDHADVGHECDSIASRSKRQRSWRRSLCVDRLGRSRLGAGCLDPEWCIIAIRGMTSRFL
jgi:hypothetical protein